MGADTTATATTKTVAPAAEEIVGRLVMLQGVLSEAASRSLPGANAMSVDVEDYFQVSAFAAQISVDDWQRHPLRVAQNVERILELFDSTGTRATFFTLGWIAEREPALIRTIARAGHEIASHGYNHRRVTEQDRDVFREDVRRTKRLLEDISDQRIIGYRAASFSINRNNLWALEVLKEVGYEYSSSVFPVRHDLYGIPDAPRGPFRLATPSVLELPLTTVRFLGNNFPCAGGGYFRLTPYPLFRWGLRHAMREHSTPCIFYFHPWEIDPDQPRVKGAALKSRLRHYVNLHRMKTRLTRLLTDFKWDRMDRVFGFAH